MKRILRKLLLLGIATAICVACGKKTDDEKSDTSLSLSKTELNFSAQNSSEVVAITTSESWTVEIPVDWITVSPMAGNGLGAITISVPENPNNEQRASYVKVNAKSDSKVITVSQAASDGKVKIENGAIKAAFSVSETKKVYFSQGNLQYQASTNIWRFAEHQYDMIGEDNVNISSTYSGWIDLFGWGTSGWNSGANAYQPYSTSSNNDDYFPGGSANNSLIGTYANADWGVYNKISNGGNKTGLWRVLSHEEWVFLCKNRTNAESKIGVAMVNGVNGVILLPDNCIIPSDISFNYGGTSDDGVDFYQTKNSYSLAQWLEMEKYGAIFLPAAGVFSEYKDVRHVGKYGFYWSSTRCDNNSIYKLGISSQGVNPSNVQVYVNLRSVRLVQDVK